MTDTIDFNFVKLVFGTLVTVGFFMIALIMMIYPTDNQIIIFLTGQMSVAFILVYRHVFQAKPK